jgi:phage head maturation protease
LLKDDVAQAREAYALMKAGAIRGLSIGYWVKADEYNRENDTRFLKEVDLIEVSSVTWQANSLAEVLGVKKIKTVTDLERYLRQAGGVSRAEARQVVHDVKSSMRQACNHSELAELIEKNIATLRG